MVKVFQDGLVTSEAAYDSRGLIAVEGLRAIQEVSAQDLNAPAVDKGRGAETVDATAIYFGKQHCHFGHFLTEGLSRFWFPWAKLFDDPIPVFSSTGSEPGPFFDFCMEAHGFTDWHVISRKKPVRYKRLVCPEKRFSINSHPGPSALEIFKPIRRAAPNKSPHGERVYLSRSKFEDESGVESKIESAYRSRGFEIVYPEMMSFEDQVAMAKVATHMAGIDGSALHLSVFMRSRSKVDVILARMTANGEPRVIRNHEIFGLISGVSVRKFDVEEIL